MTPPGRPAARDESISTRRLALLLLAVMGTLAAAGALGLWWLSRGLPPLEELERYRPVLSSRLLDSKDRLVGEFFQQKRAQVPLEEISPWLVETLVAVEDRRFRGHWGVDIYRVAGALAADLATLSYAQGASTITQQLARNLYLSREKSVARKLREILTAVQIERHYSKDEILEMYLTQAYFGHGAYGVQQAAQRYFGVDARRLDPAQSALLVGLLKAPRRYSPYHRPESALARRNLVLQLMRRRGVIRQDQLEAALARPLGVLDGERLIEGLAAPYFSEQVRLQLEDLQDDLGVDLYRDGLEIRTTLDLDMQGLAERACAAGVARLDSISRGSFLRGDWAAWARRARPDLDDWQLRGLLRDPAHLRLIDSLLTVQPALVALDPRTGAIRALVGGRDFARSRFNRATQAVRQPGSAFKPFLYTAAIDNGYPPSFRVSNQEVSVEDGTGKVWSPRNYDGKTSGLTTLRVGLRESYNLVAVRLLMDVVPPEMVVRYARQMGITTPIETDLAMALGSSGVIPLELVSAYSCFASGGIRHAPYAVEELRNRRGHVIWRHRPLSQEVLPDGTAFIMTDLLGSVINQGTGSAARWRHGFRAPAAGKTGTTNNYSDAWFVGFTPLLACGVWVGHDDPQFSLGAGMAGGQAALPIWAEFMRECYARLRLPEEKFTRPASVVEAEVCADTFEPAGPFCPNHYREFFLRAYLPAGTCAIHRVD
jgi:penicillin-binding protein 1A